MSGEGGGQSFSALLTTDDAKTLPAYLSCGGESIGWRWVKEPSIIISEDNIWMAAKSRKKKNKRVGRRGGGVEESMG